MQMVTIWVANIMLHVADDCVLPIRHIQRSVRADNSVSRAKISIFTVKQLNTGCPPNIAKFAIASISLAVKNVLLNSQKTDAITNQEVVLHLIGKMLRG